MKAQYVLLIVLVTLIGCTVGPSVVTFSPATNPQGIHASLQLNSKAEIEGELLEVSDTALVVLAVDSLVLVPFRWIRIGQFYQAGHLQIRRGRFRRSPRRNQEELRLLSRFPQGIDGEVLNRLLAAYGQTKLTIAQ